MQLFERIQLGDRSTRRRTSDGYLVAMGKAARTGCAGDLGRGGRDTASHAGGDHGCGRHVGAGRAGGDGASSPI